MQCAKCGYIMSELDPECLRCKRAGNGAVAVAAPATDRATGASGVSVADQIAAQMTRPVGAEPEKECPRCGKATAASTAECPKCGYVYRPEDAAVGSGVPLGDDGPVLPAEAGMRQTVSPAVSWSIIGACLLVMIGAAWAMLGGALAGQTGDIDTPATPPTAAHAHKARLAGPSISEVTYKVLGKGSATVTYKSADGTVVKTETPVHLPWAESFRARVGAPLSVSVKPVGAADALTAEIDVNGKPRQLASAPGADGTTTVTDTL